MTPIMIFVTMLGFKSWVHLAPATCDHIVAALAQNAPVAIVDKDGISFNIKTVTCTTLEDAQKRAEYADMFGGPGV